MSGPLSINIDTTATKTSVPFFVERSYVKVRFVKCNQEAVEGKGDALKYEFDLVDPAPNQDGGTILPGQLGSKVFLTVTLYDKNSKPGDGAPKWATEKIAKIQDAFLGTGDQDNKKGKPARPPMNAECVALMTGKEAFFQFKNPTVDRTSQDVSSFTYIGDVAGA